MSKPLVSVLMTAYNREAYLENAMLSVLASSYRNLELIVVDDASSDCTFEIARAIAASDGRVRVYRNKTNLGDYPNRNQAALYARGKYLKYVDADDMIYPHGLAVMVNAMELFPDAALGMQCNIREHIKPYPFLVSSHEAFMEHFLGKGFFTSGPTGTIIRKTMFDEAGGFQSVRFTGDTELWMRLTRKSPVVLFHPALIWWRTHPQQESVHERANYEQQLLARHSCVESALNDQDIPLNENQKREAFWRYRRFRARSVLRDLMRGNVGKAMITQKVTGISLWDILSALAPKKYA